jgi:hypothetical protein
MAALMHSSLYGNAKKKKLSCSEDTRKEDSMDLLDQTEVTRLNYLNDLTRFQQEDKGFLYFWLRTVLRYSIIPAR